MVPVPAGVSRSASDVLTAPGGPLTLLSDIGSAAEQLSPLGRALFAGELGELTRRLQELADRHGWDVIDHIAFRDWAAFRLRSCDVVFVLDKLALPHLNASNLRHDAVRAHRRLGSDGHLVLELDYVVEECRSRSGATVAVLDDAAYTGSTLAGVLDVLNGCGTEPRRVLVAATSERARRQVTARGVTLEAYSPRPVVGDVIHARDVFPWLPHSGRSAAGALARVPPRRIAPVLYQDGAWLTHPVLSRDRCLRDLAASALQRLRDYLGREPTVADVALLGADVAVPLIDTTTVVDDTTPIRSLLPPWANGCHPASVPVRGSSTPDRCGGDGRAEK